MKLDKAIEYLISEKELDETGGLPETAKAVQLGIEALELVKALRTTVAILAIKRLPSETEE